MTDRERVEQEIREVLESESHAIPLSNKLFSPGGLFSHLASTEEERRVLVRTPLFRQAQRRFLALQRAEAELFAKIAEQAKAVMPQGGYLLKLEGVVVTEGPEPPASGTRPEPRREGHAKARSGRPHGAKHP